MFLYQIASNIARRKKNFAPSALNGTKGWMLGNVWLYISFQNRQQEPRLAVRGKGTGPTDYISTNGLRFPRLPGRLCCYVMSLGVTHSLRGAGKRVKGRHRQMALTLFLRLSQVEESLRCLKRARNWSPRNLPCGGLGLSKYILSIEHKCENI